MITRAEPTKGKGRSNRNRVDKSEHSNEEPVRTLVDAVLVVARHDHDDEHAKCQLIGEPKDAVIQLVGP